MRGRGTETQNSSPLFGSMRISQNLFWWDRSRADRGISGISDGGSGWRKKPRLCCLPSVESEGGPPPALSGGHVSQLRASQGRLIANYISGHHTHIQVAIPFSRPSEEGHLPCPGGYRWHWWHRTVAHAWGRRHSVTGVRKCLPSCQAHISS